MRIALIQHARENDEASPLGLGRVAGALRAAGHDVDFLDLALASGDPAGTLLARVRDGQASALGFSLMTPQYGEFLGLARRIRPHLPGVRIVAGGPHACAAPEETLRDGGADIVVVGEGEPIAPALFDCLDKDGDLRAVAGIAFLDEAGACVRTPSAPQVADLDQLPPIPWDLMRPGDYRGRLRGRRFANVMTARGCPYHCVYCSRGPTSGRYRARSVAAVIEEVRTLQREHGIRAIDFADDLFTLDRARTLTLCEALRAVPGRIAWRCETRVDRVDRPLLRTMRQAGCVCISFGVESGSDAVLKKLRKGTTADQARRAFADCHAEGVPTRAFFMLGTPWESPETVNMTIALARELRPTFSVFFLATPYPGSELREAFRAAGWELPRDPADYRHFVEAGHFRAAAAADAAVNPRGYYIGQCRRATREVTRAQLTDLARYPTLLREALTRFTPIELLTQVALRLSRLQREAR